MALKQRWNLRWLRHKLGSVYLPALALETCVDADGRMLAGIEFFYVTCFHT